ncbi:hypothetical protein [Leucobacter soli]|uniref:hypothetical protein n=1 Tax=Leucobacter soli TaxID=2812850 RepID=UPI00361A2517
MLPKLTPNENQYGAPVEAFIPAETTGVFTMPPEHRAVWERAKPFLHVRDNDAHTLYAYGLARALCAANPDADAGVVLPAILLHDTGWSQVPEALVLTAISPSGGDPELVRRHEREECGSRPRSWSPSAPRRRSWPRSPTSSRPTTA